MTTFQVTLCSFLPDALIDVMKILFYVFDFEVPIQGITFQFFVNTASSESFLDIQQKQHVVWCNSKPESSSGYLVQYKHRQTTLRLSRNERNRINQFRVRGYTYQL